MKREDHYAVLGVAPDASDRDIKRAYKRLAVQFHPDQRPSRIADMLMRRITEAYEVLRDPERRAAYDRERGRSVKPPPSAPSSAPPSSPDHRRVGRRLDAYRRIRAREADRIGRRAIDEHAASMQELLAEHAADARRAARAARADRLRSWMWLALAIVAFFLVAKLLL